ncbi:MAG TPA: hypothetical protein VF043_25120 [Ktedonobacteraceae bacterium]
MDHKWRALSEEILFALKEWREQHPKATLLEIEEEVSQQMSRLGAQVIQDAAQSSRGLDGSSQRRGTTLSAVWKRAGVARETETTVAEQWGSTGGTGEELWNMPDLWSRAFSPWMRSWGYWRET